MPNQYPDNWTPERVEALERLWIEGKSGSEIAAAFQADHGVKLSRNSIIGKANRLKLPARVNPKAADRPPKPQRPIPMAKAKRVTLPPLPINGPVLTSDTKLLKSAAWLPLPHSVPKSIADLGDIGKPDRLGECRWPVGENPTLFCGCASYGIYCPAHAALAHPKERAA